MVPIKSIILPLCCNESLRFCDKVGLLHHEYGSTVDEYTIHCAILRSLYRSVRERWDNPPVRHQAHACLTPGLAGECAASREGLTMTLQTTHLAHIVATDSGVILRVGARSRLARAAGLGALPEVAARRGRGAGVAGRPLRRAGLIQRGRMEHRSAFKAASAVKKNRGRPNWHARGNSVCGVFVRAPLKRSYGGRVVVSFPLVKLPRGLTKVFTTPVAGSVIFKVYSGLASPP